MLDLNEKELEIARKCAKHKELALKIKQLEEELKQVDEEIKSEMAKNETDTMILGIFKVTWKDCTKTSLDSKRIKEEIPEIYEKYAKTSSYKRFLVD